MNTFLLILLFIIISFHDLRLLLKEKKRKKLIIYTSILGTAFLLSELHILGVKVIGLNQVITYTVGLFR
ncbi:hypothetical protein [Metabacillus litoralis]|uniref:hypothetical protein n=1 Tax=Metabacillus litoralis TaxID=152268 RepID=UPI000EF607AA|nr:hypothetical protein [Metabacillus litoralis]